MYNTPLFVISDPVCFKGEARLINQLFETGMDVFHLRKPGIDQRSFEKLIAEIDIRYHNKIALHQFHELHMVFPLIKRLHYPEQLRMTVFEPDLTDIEGYNLSTSIHHLDDLEKLKYFNYTFYGPVFNSISKLGYTGLHKAQLLIPDQKRKVKIIGLGGITHSNLERVSEMGFDGVAVLGTIWNDKAKAIDNFKSLLMKYKPLLN